MANSRVMWIYCCLAFAVCLGIFGVIAFVVSVSNGSDDDDDTHTYCFAAEGNVANFPQTVVGRFKLDVDSNEICWKLFYGTAGACDVDVIALKGPVNDADGFRPVKVVAEFSGPLTPQFGYVNGSEACATIDRRTLRRLLHHPYLHYVEMNTTGANFCENSVIRDYITGLCVAPDVEDDDDNHNHSHGHGHGDDDDHHGDDDDHHHNGKGGDNDDDDGPVVKKAKVASQHQFHKPQHVGRH